VTEPGCAQAPLHFSGPNRVNLTRRRTPPARRPTRIAFRTLKVNTGSALNIKTRVRAATMDIFRQPDKEAAPLWRRRRAASAKSPRRGCSGPGPRAGSGLSRLGEIPGDNLSYGVEDTVVCFRGGKAPTRRNLGAASLISFVMVAEV
jgi:hypothetical protein